MLMFSCVQILDVASGHNQYPDSSCIGATQLCLLILKASQSLYWAVFTAGSADNLF